MAQKILKCEKCVIISLQTNEGNQRRVLKPGDKPQAVFKLNGTEKEESELNKMTVTEKKNDEYMIQVRLYRMLQNRLNITPDECNKIFKDYGLFEYISLCYEEYHMQGDEANYSDLIKYLRRQGF